MNPGQRLEAIQRTAKTLEPRPYSEIDLVFNTFGVPAYDSGNWGSKYDYALDMLSRSDNENLVELDAYLRGQGSTSAVDEGQIWDSGTLRLFISHTSTHKKRAAALAARASRVGIHGFVAHDTIEPSSEWQAVIEAALLTCDALVAMVTDDFVTSRWCDQEVGFVVAQQKPVLALKMGADPHGFMGRFQAIPSTIAKDNSFDDVHAIVRALVQHPSISAKAAPVAVHRYVRSGTFDSARQAYEIIRAIAPQDWTPAMIEEVDRANAANSQITHANLDGGGPVVDAVNALLEPLRPKVVPLTGEDDIPF